MPIINDMDVWEQIVKEATKKPSEETIKRNKEALELLKKVQNKQE